MNNADIKTKVIEEIQLVPEGQLPALYDLIHSFRLRSIDEDSSPESIMHFAGCWSDLPSGIFTDFLDEISQRRKQAFSQRNRETSFD